MKRLFVLAVVLAMLFGCATLGIVSKTSTGYTYTSSINPEDIESGKHKLIQSGMMNPFVAIGFYYQTEKDRVVAGIFAYSDKVKDFVLIRFFYVDRGRLLIFDRDDEKKEWLKRNLADLQIGPSREVEVIANIKMIYDRYKQTENL